MGNGQPGQMLGVARPSPVNGPQMELEDDVLTGTRTWADLDEPTRAMVKEEAEARNVGIMASDELRAAPMVNLFAKAGRARRARGEPYPT